MTAVGSARASLPCFSLTGLDRSAPGAYDSFDPADLLCLQGIRHDAAHKALQALEITERQLQALVDAHVKDAAERLRKSLRAA